MKNFSTSFLVLSALAASPVLADNPNYVPGDLILFFQQENGPQTIFANLGNAATLYRGAAAGATDGVNSVNFLNINAALTTAFGDDWASDPTVYAGLAAVWGTNNLASNNTLQDGDPNRTIYVSQSRDNVGAVGQASSSGYVVNTNGGMTTGSSGILQMSLYYDTSLLNAVEVVPVGQSSIDDQNPFFAPAQQGPAFGIFPSGVQQVGTAGTFGTFGAAGSVEFALDLYRILGKNTAPGQVAGDLRNGSYEGTITINTSGQVSFISQGAASSAFDTWMGGFTTITAPADKLPTADPDGDGATNLQEFGFGGNPESGADSGVGQVQTVDADADTQKDLTLTLEVRSGTSFSPSGNDLVSAAIDEVVYRIEGSTDLLNWDSAVSEVTPQIGSGSPSSGYVLKTFRLNSGSGLSGKGFLRASVVK